MRVTRDQIDPELRTAGVLAKLLFRPSRRFFKLMRKLEKRAEGKSVATLECEQRWVSSLDEGIRGNGREYGHKIVTVDTATRLAYDRTDSSGFERELRR